MPSRSRPLTPEPLQRLLDGFRGTKVLAASVRLGLFDLLAREGELDASGCGARLGIADRPVRMLLTACTALGLLERDGERFANAPLADEFLVSHRPRYYGDFVLLLDEEQYRPWADLDVSLREDRPVAWGAQAEKRFPADRAEAEPRFWKGMSSVAASTAAAVAASFDFSPFSALLDVGGGQGDFSVELCRRHATLRATVYDLPSVCRLASRKACAAGLAHRVAMCPGDVLTAPALPTGHDVLLLSNVLHMWDEPTAVNVLRKCHAALPAGGSLVIAEAFVDDDGSGPVTAALMSLNMLVHTARGRNYSRGEYETWLGQAGFATTRRIPLTGAAPSANGLVVGQK